MCGLANDDELRLVEARFRALVHEWELGPCQVAALLGVDAADLGFDLVPRAWSQAAERRMRMLVEIRGMIPSLVADDRDVPVWLRADPVDIVDHDGLPIPSPLAFMCGPSENVRQLMHALRAELGR